MLILMIFLTSCSAGTNYSNECLWYKPVNLSNETKKLFKDVKPGSIVIKDLEKIIHNNQLFHDLC